MSEIEQFETMRDFFCLILMIAGFGFLPGMALGARLHRYINLPEDD